MIADLHTHTSASDGSLDPAALLARAGTAGIELLSITDHDTLAGYTELAGKPSDSLRIVAGIELSSEWEGCGIHVVGLNVGLSSDAMRSATTFQRDARTRRAQQIADKLERAGVSGALEGAQAYAGDGLIGRPDFARYLVAQGTVKNFGQAFRKYLGAGKIGDVKQHWESMATVIGWVRDAGGTAVLAHPARYGFTASKRNHLIAAFAAAGGQALEVVSGRQDRELTATLAKAATAAGLLTSCGSDFHHDNQPWSRLGMPLTLPGQCRPVWESW